MIIGAICFVEVRNDWQEGTKRESGSNDARHIVWAISTLFFFIWCCFSLLIYIYRYYMCHGAMDGPAGGYNGKNRPKWLHIVSFGPFVSLLLLLFVFFNISWSYNSILQLLLILLTHRNTMIKLRRGKQAQTTWNMSFGPLVFSFLLLITLLFEYTYVRFV